MITELIAKHGLIADFLHKQWPEWRDPEGTAKGSLPLEPEDVIGQAIGEEDEIERITREIQRCKVRKRLFRPAETLEYWGYVRVVSDGGRGSLVDLDL